jgi:hypothetical protein
VEEKADVSPLPTGCKLSGQEKRKFFIIDDLIIDDHLNDFSLTNC